MLSRRTFVCGSIGAGLGIAFAIWSGESVTSNFKDDEARKEIPELREAEFIDVPPDEYNLREYTQAVEYFENGATPYSGYVPPCSLAQARQALKEMDEWSIAVASAYDIESNYGTETASGIPLNDYDLTIAHKDLPLGTMVKIWWHGKSVIAKVTDRGPYIDGRDFDLAAGTCMELSGFAPLDWGVREIWWRYA